MVILELSDLQELLLLKQQQLENLKKVVATGITDADRVYGDKITALENKLASEEDHARRRVDQELSELRHETAEKVRTLQAQRTIEASKLREETAAKLIETENSVRKLEIGVNKTLAEKAIADKALADKAGADVKK